MTETNRTFDPFDGPLMLRKFPNGGWIVTQDPAEGLRRTEIGAYGSSKEMIAALSILVELTYMPPTGTSPGDVIWVK